MTTRFFYNFILLFALIFSVAIAHAESGSMAYNSTVSLTQAMNSRHELCEELKVNPRCSLLLNRMHGEMGLTITGCAIQQKALKCDAYIAKNPQYKNQQMRCDPYDVCRNTLESTFVRGCGANLQQQLDALKEIWKCGTSWACAKMHFPKLDEATFKKISMHLIPGYGLYQMGKAIYSGARDDIKKYPHVACLSPELQAQFSCHLVMEYGGMLLPIGGAAVKGASMALRAADMAVLEESLVAEEAGVVTARNGEAAAANSATSRAATHVADREAAGAGAHPHSAVEHGPLEAPHWQVHESPAQFKKRLLHYDPTTDAQRMEMMDFVRSSRARGSLVFDEEFAGAKELNGKIDKDVVTAMAAQRKEILLEKFKAFGEKYKDVLDVGPIYSDFKPLRIALVPKNRVVRVTGFPPSVYSDLQKIVDETNVEMDKKISALGLKTQSSAKLFRAGLDNSADEANLNARFAKPGKIARASDPQITQAKIEAYKNLRTQGASMQASLGSGSPLVEMHGTSAILKPEVFDVIKKAKGSATDVRQTLARLYPGTQVSDQAISDMINYAKLTDHFQPGIWSSTRTVASLSDAKFGGISIDVKGMGAHNAYQTALRALTCTSPSHLVMCTRDGERAVTREFQDRLTKIRDVALKNCAHAKVKCSVSISGDDVKVVPLHKPFPPEFAAKNIEGINDSVGAGKIRQAEILPNMSEHERELAAGHGEKIESILATSLSQGPLALKAKNMTFSVRMMTDRAGHGEVNIVARGPGAAALTEQEKIDLQQAYQQAISDMNKTDDANHQYVIHAP